MKETVRRGFFLFLFLVTVVGVVESPSCSKKPDGYKGYKYYKVKAGHHYKVVPVKPLTKPYVTFSLLTNETWAWEYRNHDDKDLSKLGGVAFGYSHNTSVRVGYRRLADGTYELWYYVWLRRNSPQKTKLKGVMWSGKVLPKEIFIRCGWRDWTLYVNIHAESPRIDAEKIINTDYSPNVPAFFSHPYAGGDNTVQNDWIIGIKFY